MQLKSLIIALILLTATNTVYAIDNRCTKEGGDIPCMEYHVSDWSKEYQVCDNIDRIWDIAYCLHIRGGEIIEGNPICQNPTPLTEKNITERFDNYAKAWTKKIIHSEDSGWGYDNRDESCWGSDPTYQGIKLFDVRKFEYTAEPQNVILKAIKTRELQCPKDRKDNNTGCVLPSKVTGSCPVENSNDNMAGNSKVGNPCSVTTGNKTLTETDWTNYNSPLKITRYYNSLYSNQTNYQAWTHNYQSSLKIGLIKDIYLNTNKQSLQENNTAIVLNRSNGTKAIAQRKFTNKKSPTWFIDRDLSLQLTNIDNTKWQVKNVKTGVVETYQTLDKQATDPQDEEYFNFVLTRIDYPNGQFVSLNYNSKQQLTTVTDNQGKQLTYHYQNGNLTSIDLPNGKQIQYGYDYLGRLNTVKKAGYGTKTYLYDESDKAPNDNPNLLTGIIDENGKRYASYAYDHQNRGILTEHANHSQRFELDFKDKDTTIVTDEYGSSRIYSHSPVSGTERIINYRNGEYTAHKSYDKNGNIIYSSKNNQTTRYEYDEARNLPIKEIKYADENIITLTEWHDSLPVKIKVTEGIANSDDTLKKALRITKFTHDNHGNILTKTISDPQTNESRTWKYTYNANNQKLSETNPQNLTQKWTYDKNGNLLTYTDNQGLTTTYSKHNLDGKPQIITSPTGQITTLEYDEAGRITNQSVNIIAPKLTNIAQKKSAFIKFKNWWRKLFKMPLLPNPVKYDVNIANQTATTSYQYDGVGQLIKATLPDGEVLTYTYDDAHRLIAITDNLGNKTKYTLNGAGDITQTESYDPQGKLANSSKQTFDYLGRLAQEQGNNGQFKKYSYVYENPMDIDDSLGRRVRQRYDKLNRLTYERNTDFNETKYQYDGLGNLIKIIDPKGNATTYKINAFGETLQQNSPDTGLTTYQYNKGRLTKVTDSEGREQNYHYDKKGRLSKTTDRTGKILAEYYYDNYGRISKITDTATTTQYQYDSANRIVDKIQTVSGGNQQQRVRYSYTAGGKQAQLLLANGRLVNYHYQQGKLTSVSVKHNDITTEIINKLTYSPNGITGYTWGQTNQPVSYDYDLDGRLTKITDNALDRSYQYDVGNRITDIIDNQGKLNFNYRHDDLDRLINQSLSLGNRHQALSYEYDKNSNRTRKTEQGKSVNTPVEQESNKYSDYSYDSSGRTLDDGVRQYEYNNLGRISRVINGANVGNYEYNALGQRIKKTANGQTTYFVYDEQGKLIGEYDGNNSPIREYIYLGNMPIAMLSNERENEVLQIHTDHLGTPRAVTNSNSKTLWKWEGDAFGSQSPQVEQVKLPLRMAGQYFDNESELFYNYFRYYDPKTGRYITSDPIGLEGGLNTFGYVESDPLLWSDPFGLIYAPGVDNVSPIIPPSIPQDSYEVLIGYSDALSIGIGPYARNAIGIDAGIDYSCSKLYSQGEATSIFVGQIGISRSMYIAGSKLLASSTNPTILKRGSQVRNFLKQYFGPAVIPHRNFQVFRDKIKPWEIWVEDKGFKGARAGLGRTNKEWNKRLLPYTVGKGGHVNRANREDCSCE